MALLRRPRARSVWRSALARLAPHAALGDVLTMVAPVLRGERLLAVMPFLLRFVSDGAAAASGADEEAAVAAVAAGGALAIPRAGMREIVRAAAESIAALFRPPLVF